ncbi:Amine oxidase [flavin-containing] [Zootermopsis nevadensis]|uniref:Amine oxidase n=1 Tax=Zootermopsis nevadensis TaxID=136037 RepID=A0A067QX02_ZOONE|nr:Amine oxidase [flavin-containing] [Zootermopsis nevadensis]
MSPPLTLQVIAIAGLWYLADMHQASSLGPYQYLVSITTIACRDAREFLEVMAVANNTAEDHEMSLLFFLWYLHQAQGVNHIWQIKGGAQECKIIGGSQQLSIKMAKNLGDRIHLKNAVVQIIHMNDGVMVKTLDGTVFNGSHVIMAIPPFAHVVVVVSRLYNPVVGFCRLLSGGFLVLVMK